MDESRINDAQEDKLDTSTSEESQKPKLQFALQIDLNNKENDKGDCKTSTPNTGQNMNVTKKPQTPTESTHHTLRAPYAQPVSDASKLSETKISSIEERLSSAKERRLQQQRHQERGLKMKIEREDEAHAKWMQSLEDKRRKVEENRSKEDQHRKEVEMRKKQQIEEDKKKAEAKIARTDQVHEVTMRQKRSTSADRRMKRRSWGGADGDDQKSASQINLNSPPVTKQSSDKFSKSPLLVNSPHMAFASGLRSYDSGTGKGSSPGRSTTSGLTEPISISARLLAPTKSSLARSRNAVSDLDDTASQSSNDSKSHGPMRSRSTDRRSPATARSNTAGASPRVDPPKGGASKQTPERKPTPTRGTSSPMVPNHSASSPSTSAAPTASSGTKRSISNQSTPSEMNKANRGTSPQPRPLRAPSPGRRQRSSDTSHTTPTRTTPKKRRPSPAATKTKSKTQNDSPKLVSTPPNIKPSLRTTPSNQMKAKTSPTTKPVPTKTPKAAATKAKQETPRQTQKLGEPAGKNQKPVENAEEDKPTQENLPTSNSGVAISTSGMISKSANDTSQGVSDILTSDTKQRDAKPEESSQNDQDNKTEKPAADESENSTQSKENTAEPAKIIELPASEDTASIKQVTQLEEPKPESPQIVEQISTIKTDSEVIEGQEISPPEPSPAEAPKIVEKEPSSDETPEEIILAAESGFHLNEEDGAQNAGDIPLDNQDSLTSFHTMEPVDLRAISPTDSFEDIVPEQDEIPQSQSLQQQLAEESDIPQPDSFDDESEEDQPSVKENVPESKESAEEDEKLEETEAEESNASVNSEENRQEEGAKEEVSETVQKEEEESMEKAIAPDAAVVEIPAEQDKPTPDKTTMIEETNNQTALVEPQRPSETTNIEETNNQTALVELQQPSDGQFPTGEAEKTADDSVKDELQENGEEGTSQTNVEGTQNAERKSQPRKNLVTDEEKEAYRQVIAEKRKELKEKKVQEERERQERITLAKIEQAKREEEARRMFEEAAASAEMEKKLEEERVREREEEEQKRQEEEKIKEEEENERKLEAAENMRKEREVQKQKQEDERVARKKRLEMIMRRTRHPDATGDSSTPKSNDSASPLGTPSPQQSPASGRSPSTQSPAGGNSPLTAVTPERSVSPAAVLNKSSESLPTLHASDEPRETSISSSISEPNLLNFTNIASKYESSEVELITIDSEKPSVPTNIERPVPFEAFTEKNISNGVEESSANHNGSNNMDPPGLLSNGSQNPQEMDVPVNGSEDLLDFSTDVMQQKVTTEPLVSTEI